MDTILQDVRYGLRMLRKSPSFTAIAVLTLALGIGATTAIFSVVDGVLLRPLPYDKPDQIVRLWEVDARGHRMDSTDPNFEDLRRQNHSLQGLAEYAPGLVSVSGGSEPTRTTAAFVSRDFFPLMRVQPILGRGFADEDQHFGAAPTALVSYSYWRQYLNGASDLSSSKLTVQDQAVSVIGVLPPGFRFPENADIWMPRELRRQLPSRSAHNWRLLGRLRDGVSPDQAQADMATIARQIKQQYGQDVDMTNVSLDRLQDAMTQDVRPALLILMGAVGFLLLIACANVANLLLAQASSRERELAIRSAIGAVDGRLVRQFLGGSASALHNWGRAGRVTGALGSGRTVQHGACGFAVVERCIHQPAGAAFRHRSPDIWWLWDSGSSACSALPRQTCSMRWRSTDAHSAALPEGRACSSRNYCGTDRNHPGPADRSGPVGTQPGACTLDQSRLSQPSMS